MGIAFWSDWTCERLKLPADASGSRVACDARSGACDPSVLADPLNRNVSIVDVPGLHAKVYTGNKGVVITSANTSANGIGEEADEIPYSLEAGYITERFEDREATRHWFAALFEKGELGTTADLPELKDYWCFDGLCALNRRIATQDAPKLEKTVLTGIELRIAAPKHGRLNARVLFSDQIADQHMHDFLSTLRLELTERPLSQDALVDYARNAADADKLRKHGFDRKKVDASDDLAFEAGCAVAELKVNSDKKAIAKAPTGMAVGFKPFDTNNGLSSIDSMAHYAYALGIYQSSPSFETRNEAMWDAFVGRRTDKNVAWFGAVQSALQGVRLPVSRSDPHQLKGTARDNDKRGYGDYPSGRVTWIKADPTWCGLPHAIYFIGRLQIGDTFWETDDDK